MRAILTFAAIALIGCGGVDEQTLPAPLTGYFHHEQVDATNVRLNDDGTFRWTIYGCDFGGGGDGVWTRVDNDRVILAPNAGESLAWVSDLSFQNPVANVELVAADGGLTAIGRADDDHMLFTQSWPAGGACAQCGGPLGPTGQCACADPFGSAVCQ